MQCVQREAMGRAPIADDFVILGIVTREPGTVGQCLSMVITFACLIPQYIDPANTAPASGAAAGLFLYIAFFGATWLPLPWLYPAEVNPVKTRGKANAVSTCTNWLFNFVSLLNWHLYLIWGRCRMSKRSNVNSIACRHGDSPNVC